MAKVLLVEDDNNLREIYQARLMAEGYDIVAAQNGEEALVVAKQNKPDLIVSDVMMPRISGFEMLDILRNTDELKHTKVIMLTALGQAEDQKRASGLGADKYLVKSQVTLEDIVNAAKELLGEDSGGVADVPPAPAMPDPIAAAEPATPPAAPAPAPEPAPATAAPATPAVTTTGALPVATPPEPAAAPAAAPTALPEPPAPPAPATVTPAPAEPAMPPTPPAAPTATPAAAPTVATAAVPVVEPPAPTPEPAPVISMPSTDPTPQAASATSAAAAVSDAATQTLEAEEAALQSQIDSYAKAPAETPLAVNPEEAKAEASNNQTIAAAVEQLNSPAPDTPLQPPSAVNAAAPVEPAAPPTLATPPTPPAPVATPAAPAPEPAAVPAPAPAPTAAPAAPDGDNNVNVAGRKVIQPISSPDTKPDLNALLAKEEAAAPAAPTPAAPVVGGDAATPAPATPPTPPAHAPGQSFDPNKAL